MFENHTSKTSKMLVCVLFSTTAGMAALTAQRMRPSRRHGSDGRYCCEWALVSPVKRLAG